MRTEDIDWAIYCIISRQSPVQISRISEIIHLPSAEIDAAISRLEAMDLVKRDGNLLSPTPFQELFIKCQMKYGQNSPIYIEDGIIKVKPGWVRKHQ